MNAALEQTLNRLAKWRSVLAGWQLGTRADTDAECQAVRDHREVTLMLRVEVNTLLSLLLAKGVFTQAEFEAQLAEEAEHLDASLRKRFPGFRATDNGIAMNPTIASDTMRGWRP
jgi:hypothetical protein